MSSSLTKRLLQILPIALTLYALVMIGHGAMIWLGQAPANGGIARPGVYPLGKVAIIHSDTLPETSITVEVAETPDQQAYGLMFRKSLDAGTGMYFPMIPPRKVNFWMKNTLIPLDIIFVGRDGTISQITPNAVPQSLSHISSRDPVQGVLEIGGGEAERLGIKVGDLLHLKAD